MVKGTAGVRRIAYVLFSLVAWLGGCGGAGPRQTSGIGVPDGGEADAGGDAGLAPGARPAPIIPVFDDNQVHELRLEMAPVDWQSIIDDSRADDWRHATLTYDGALLTDVGVRPSGEASRFPGNPKMSIRIKFNAFAGTETFGGLETINVKGEYEDTSLLRERLALFVFQSAMPTPRAAHGQLIVNGELRGLFTLREIWDSTSIKQHFPEPVGPLYRLRPPADVDPYAYLGAAPDSYVPLPWEPHITNTARGDDVIGPFLAALTGGSERVEQATDVENLLAYLACNAVVMNTDGLTGETGVEDHFQYFDPASGKFFILPWDPDNTFSSQDETPDRYPEAHFSRSQLGRVVRDTEEIHARYLAKIAAIMASMPAERVTAEADRIRIQIQQAAYADPNKPQSNDAFEWAVGYIKDFVPKRYEYLRQAVQ